VKQKIFFLCALLPFVVILFLSCNQQNNSAPTVKKSDPQDSSYIQVIKHTNAEIEKLMMDSNFDGLLVFFTKDILLLPPLSTEIRGIDALRKHYEEQKKQGVKIRAFGGKMEKLWMTDNIVYEYGTYGAAGTAKGLNKPLAQTGYYFMMWEKQTDGRFLIKYLIENLDFNPCE
jgi:ketosteroid isomerase-like protein